MSNAEEPAKPRTRAALEAQVAELNEKLHLLERVLHAKTGELDNATAREKTAGDRLNDLKTRLATSEADNQRMRGYIARVQEDDVVREELVSIGEPDGEQQLVPKRKPTPFSEPNAYSAMGECVTEGRMYHGDQSQRRKPKHWVTY